MQCFSIQTPQTALTCDSCAFANLHSSPVAVCCCAVRNGLAATEVVREVCPHTDRPTFCVKAPAGTAAAEEQDSKESQRQQALGHGTDICVVL
jgi:hypothetical protein